MSELKKFVLVVKYGERDVFFCHHTIKVTGRSIDGSVSEWHSEDSTFLPRSIAITLPDAIKEQFSVVVSIHNKLPERSFRPSERRLIRPETAVYCLNFHPISP
jgi:hypothetical protein